jgi:hypothetical protein
MPDDDEMLECYPPDRRSVSGTVEASPATPAVVSVREFPNLNERRCIKDIPDDDTEMLECYPPSTPNEVTPLRQVDRRSVTDSVEASPATTAIVSVREFPNLNERRCFEDMSDDDEILEFSPSSTPNEVTPPVQQVDRQSVTDSVEASPTLVSGTHVSESPLASAGSRPSHHSR